MKMPGRAWLWGSLLVALATGLGYAAEMDPDFWATEPDGRAAHGLGSFAALRPGGAVMTTSYPLATTLSPERYGSMHAADKV